MAAQPNRRGDAGKTPAPDRPTNWTDWQECLKWRHRRANRTERAMRCIHRMMLALGAGAVLAGLAAMPPARARVGVFFGFAPPLYVAPPYYYPPPIYYPPPPVWYTPPPPAESYTPPAYAPAAAPARSCYAGAYVCPMQTAVSAGTTCWCPDNSGQTCLRPGSLSVAQPEFAAAHRGLCADRRLHDGGAGEPSRFNRLAVLAALRQPGLLRRVARYSRAPATGASAPPIRGRGSAAAIIPAR